MCVLTSSVYFYAVFFKLSLLLSFPSLPEENFVTVDAECYQVLLSFALAHGTVNTILDILRILIGIV